MFLFLINFGLSVTRPRDVDRKKNGSGTMTHTQSQLKIIGISTNEIGNTRAGAHGQRTLRGRLVRVKRKVYKNVKR